MPYCSLTCPRISLKFTLEQLGVVNLNAIELSNQDRTVRVAITPTIPHCSMITLIGLCVKVQLLRLLPEYMRVSVVLEKNSHMQEAEGSSLRSFQHHLLLSAYYDTALRISNYFYQTQLK